MGFHIGWPAHAVREADMHDVALDAQGTGAPSVGRQPRALLARRVGRLAVVLTAVALIGSMATHPLPNLALRDVTLPGGTTVPLPTLTGSIATSAYASNAKVGIASTPDGAGYWLVQPDGGVITHGDAGFRGSMGGQTLNKPMVALVRTATGLGYWEVGADGGEFTFPNNDATFLQNCSQAGKTLNAPIVGATPMPTVANDQGFWMVGADGGVFTCGTAQFYNPPVNGTTTAPIVGIAATPDGLGYWLVGSDGHVYPRGDAYNCSCSVFSQAPIVGIVPTPFNRGYWLVASDGGVFSVGDANNGFYGSIGGQGYTSFTAMGATYDERGYWLVNANGSVLPFGDAGVWQ